MPKAMPRQLRLLILLMLLPWHAPVLAQGIGMGMEDVPLRPSELKMLKRITAVDPAFLHGDRARRYFRTHPTTRNRIPLRVEVIARKTRGLYFGEFITYNMTIDEPAGLVTYEYDAGTAHRGRGSILVTPKDVVKTEYRCGIASCSIFVERNGRRVAERSD